MDELKLVVFDLAGTTIADRGGIAQAFRSAFASQRIDISDEQLDAVRGHAKYDAVVRLLAATKQPAHFASEIYDALQHAVRDLGVVPIDGAEAAIRSLRAHGVRVALNSGLDRETVAFIVDKLGWRPIIDALISSDDVAEGRPAPYMIFRAMEATRTHSVANVAVAGDTESDLLAASNARVRWNIGVLTGAHARERLERAPHTGIVASVRELTPEYFAELH